MTTTAVAETGTTRRGPAPRLGTVPDDAPGPATPVGSAEVRTPPGWIRRRRVPGSGWLVASRIVLVLVGAITMMVVALAVGMRLNDRQIERHLGTATATVLSISPLRTGIEFVDGAGVTVRPADGVLYPGLLSTGQQFKIEYCTQDPSLVRVAGRTAAVGNVSLAITLLVSWLLGSALVWRFRSRVTRARRPRRGPFRADRAR